MCILKWFFVTKKKNVIQPQPKIGQIKIRTARKLYSFIETRAVIRRSSLETIS